MILVCARFALECPHPPSRSSGTHAQRAPALRRRGSCWFSVAPCKRGDAKCAQTSLSCEARVPSGRGCLSYAKAGEGTPRQSGDITHQSKTAPRYLTKARFSSKVTNYFPFAGSLSNVRLICSMTKQRNTSPSCISLKPLAEMPHSLPMPISLTSSL